MTASNRPISLSAGLAIYLRDGNTVETLTDAADRSLYRMNAQPKSNSMVLKRTAL